VIYFQIFIIGVIIAGLFKSISYVEQNQQFIHKRKKPEGDRPTIGYTHRRKPPPGAKSLSRTYVSTNVRPSRPEVPKQNVICIKVSDSQRLTHTTNITTTKPELPISNQAKEKEIEPYNPDKELTQKFIDAGIIKENEGGI